MQMLKLDKKFLVDLFDDNIKEIFVFFYEAGCSGKKIDISTTSFNKDELINLGNIEGIDVFVRPEEKQFLEDATIVRTIKADHTGKEKVRYIYNSEEVQDRCGCGTSFAFEKKVPKIDIGKIKDLKQFSFKK